MITFFVRSGEMNCDFPDGHGFSFLPCFFLIRVGMIRFIQMDPTQKKTHSVGEPEIFQQRKKQQEKTWKSYHKTSEGTLSCCEWKTRLGKHGFDVKKTQN